MSDQEDQSSQLSNDQVTLEGILAALKNPFFTQMPEHLQITSLRNDANASYQHYEKTSLIGDLHQTISLWRAVVARAATDSPSLPDYLYSLGDCLSDRYAFTGQLVDLEEAIDAFKRTVALASSDSPDFPAYLINLGICWQEHYGSTGQREDLDQPIKPFPHPQPLFPSNSPHPPSPLINFSTRLQI